MAMMVVAVFGERGGGARWGAMAGLITSIEGGGHSEGWGVKASGRYGWRDSREVGEGRKADRQEVEGGSDEWDPPVSERERGGWERIRLS
jgi:hypothetical protein